MTPPDPEFTMVHGVRRVTDVPADELAAITHTGICPACGQRVAIDRTTHEMITTNGMVCLCEPCLAELAVFCGDAAVAVKYEVLPGGAIRLAEPDTPEGTT